MFKLKAHLLKICWAKSKFYLENDVAFRKAYEYQWNVSDNMKINKEAKINSIMVNSPQKEKTVKKITDFFIMYKHV